MENTTLTFNIINEDITLTFNIINENALHSIP